MKNIYVEGKTKFKMVTENLSYFYSVFIFNPQTNQSN